MSKTLSYKGFIGTAEVSLDDGCLVGKVLFIRDLIMYSGETIEQLKSAFEEAVDGYLEDCEALGRSPNKPLTGSFNVRVSPELHEALVVKALERHDGVLNKAVIEAVERYVAMDKAQPIHVNITHEHRYVKVQAPRPIHYDNEPHWNILEARGVMQ